MREDSGGLFPPLRFPADLPAAGTCEFVVSGSAIVLRIAPLGNDVAVLLKPEQGRMPGTQKSTSLTFDSRVGDLASI